jgi:hypothetical protein
MDALAHSGAFWVGLIGGLVLIYFLPTMIGGIRKVESLGLLIFPNVLPTGVGWFAAMVLACMLPAASRRRRIGPASTLRSISRCSEASFWLLEAEECWPHDQGRAQR